MDGDLGWSAAGTVSRASFDRMVAEVCLGKVGGSGRARGIAIRTKQPRVATVDRSVCRVVDTVLIDQETVYTSRQSNNRLNNAASKTTRYTLTCSGIPDRTTLVGQSIIYTGSVSRPSYFCS